ncbi:Motile Sperm domain containing protein [Trichuris trichiura]|uniref:Major sperm protein n=1 Tax=Trichuris trichiura TaxID=36087 RepID=A0A077ZMN5_TRITR|nr:Motile Sperm domain containing protein [Trichuris trichiura]
MTERAYLDVNADIIVFSWPFDQPQVAVVTLRNTGNTCISVKCKTTEKYAIRFSWVYTLLQPGESKKLHIRCEPIGEIPVHRGEKHITFEYMTVRKMTNDLVKLWKLCSYSEKKILELHFDRRHSKKTRKIHHENKGGVSKPPPPEQDDKRWIRKNYDNNDQLGLPPFSVGRPCAQKNANKLITFPDPVPLVDAQDGKGNKPIKIRAKISPGPAKPVDLPPADKIEPVVVESEKGGYAKIISPKCRGDPKGNELNEQLEIANAPGRPPEQISDGNLTKDLAKFEIDVFAKVVPKGMDKIQEGDKRHGNFKIGLSDEPKAVHLVKPELNEVLVEPKKIGGKPDNNAPRSPDRPNLACPPGSPDLLDRRATDPLSFPISVRSPQSGEFSSPVIRSPMSPSTPGESKPAGIPTGSDDIFQIPPSLTAAEKGGAKMNEWNKEQESPAPTAQGKQNDKPDLLKKL